MGDEPMDVSALVCEIAARIDAAQSIYGTAVFHNGKWVHPARLSPSTAPVVATAFEDIPAGSEVTIDLELGLASRVRHEFDELD